MKRHGYLVALLLVAIVITGCTVTVSNYGSVEGYVYIPQGSAMEAGAMEMEPLFSDLAQAPYGYEPAEHVRIVVGSRTTDTGSDGFFRLTNVPARTYTLTASGGPLRFPIKMQISVQVGRVTGFGKEYGTSPLYGGIGYYIVIGIDDYLYEDHILPGPVDDAKAVYKALFEDNKLAGMGELLINGKAKKADIKYWIEEAAYLAEGSEDYLVIYFSGNAGVNFLSPWDDNGEPDDSQVISDIELEEWVSEFPGQVTLIVDGAHSETMADGKLFEPFALRGDTNYTVLAGARDEQKVTHDPELGHSVFTYWFLRGLTSRAADSPPKDRDITTKELYEYTKAEMYRYFNNNTDGDYHVPYFFEGFYGDSVIYRY
jgi:hypothetical protein